MKKMFLSALVAGTMIVGTGVALAEQPANPGENGHCTAFFNGNKNGHEKQKERTGSYPGPFQDLVDRQSDSNNNTDDIEELRGYCESVYGVMGNPDHGRWTCVLNNNGTQDNANDDYYDCTENN